MRTVCWATAERVAEVHAASAKQQAAWTTAYDNALKSAKESPPHLSVPRCSCGPVSAMMSAMLTLGQRGAMDGLLLTSQHFYQTDYTRSLLFTADPDNDIVDAHALVLLATGLGILGMGTAFTGAMHGNIPEASRGIPLILLGLWWTGRELGRSMLASRTSRSTVEHRIGG